MKKIKEYDYWGELIELCKEENSLIKRKLLIDELTRWGFVLIVCLLLTVIFLQ